MDRGRVRSRKEGSEHNGRSRWNLAGAAAAVLLLAVWRPGDGTAVGARLGLMLLGAVVMVVLWHAQEFLDWRAMRRGEARPAGGAARKWSLRVAGVLLFGLITNHAFARVGGYRAALQVAGHDVSDPAVCRFLPHVNRQWTDPQGGVHEQRINGLGFRGREPRTERARPDDLRVALFGDSMIYGVGVEDDETLAVALEAELRAAFPGRGVEVLNFGLPNTTVHTSLANYAALGRAFRPDAVVISHPIDVNPNDVCDQIRSIRDSRLLSWLMTAAPGRAIVNEYLIRRREVYSRDAAVEAVQASLRALAADQRASGLEVAFLEHWEYGGMDALLGDQVRDTLEEITPDELRVHYIGGGVDMEEYERRFAIPGDGHPTAAGQRYYAKRIADVLIPALRAKAG